MTGTALISRSVRTAAASRTVLSWWIDTGFGDIRSPAVSASRYSRIDSAFAFAFTMMPLRYLGNAGIRPRSVLNPRPRERLLGGGCRHRHGLGEGGPDRQDRARRLARHPLGHAAHQQPL